MMVTTAVGRTGNPGTAKEDRLSAQDVEIQVRIENAGLVARWIRFGLPAAWVFFLAVASLWQVRDMMDPASGLPQQNGAYYLGTLLYRLWGAACSGVTAGFALSLPLAALYRRLRCGQFRRELAALPPQRQARILRSLCSSEGDPGRIADRLAGDLRLHRSPGELLPADAPAGRGTELVG